MKFIIYCCCSVTKWCQLFVTPWTAAYQAFLSITNSWSLLKLMSIELVMPSNHLIFCHPLLLLPSIFLSIRVFSTELAVCIRWPKDWHISFSTSTSNEYSGLISFRADLFDLLALHYCLIQNSGGSGSSLMPHKVDFYPCCFPPTKPHIQRPPHDSHWPRGHLHTKDREGGSSHLPGFLSKASVHIPSCPLASTGSQAHDLATERVGNECLVFSGSMMRSDHHQQEEGAEEGLLNKQPRVLGTQTKDSVEHRCRILRGVHTHFIEKVI